MALLPLAGPRTEDNAGHMDVRSYFSAIATVARRVQVTVGEMQYAADRARQLKLSEGESDRAPDTYAEFLLRTSGTLMREPSARCRGPRGLHRYGGDHVAEVGGPGGVAGYLDG
jgi:hypothetical protein